MKYKTAALKCGKYNLTKHGAQKDANTAFKNDIKKVTHLIKNHSIKKGYCIFLTNDHLYWNGKNQLAPVNEWTTFSQVGENENNIFKFYIVEIPNENSNIIS